MAGPFDFTGQNIEDTYQRLVQVSGSGFCDGTGSAISIGGSQNLQQVTDQGASTTTPITASVISASGAVTVNELTASGLQYPSTDSDDGYVIMTNGAGVLTLEANVNYVTVKNVHGSTLTKGTPVHATGTSGNTPEVIVASASNAATMPATFVLAEDLNDDEEGRAVLSGFMNGISTTGFTEGNNLYVAPNGGYTQTKPTGADLIQNIAIVGKVDSTNGSIFVYGSGRSNDVPNFINCTQITASGDISASGTLFADDIRATLPTGQDNSVVILDADGRLKTDEIDGDVFDTGRLAKSFANFDNFPNYSNQVAVWRDNISLRGYTPITADSDGILIATAFSASGHTTASFIQLLDVDKLRVNGVLIGERIGTDTKIGNTADTRTIIQSPKLEATNLNITGEITGSFDGGTF